MYHILFVIVTEYKTLYVEYLCISRSCNFKVNFNCLGETLLHKQMIISHALLIIMQPISAEIQKRTIPTRHDDE